MGKLVSFLTRRWLFIICMALIIFIIIVLAKTVPDEKQKEYRISSREVSKYFDESVYKNSAPPISYNSPCPEFVAETIDGEKIDLLAFSGKIIIIRFTSFGKNALPNLIYLDNLAEKWESDGVILILVDYFGTSPNKSPIEYPNFHSRIIGNESSLRSLFGAKPEETIIVARDNLIKFQYQTNDKRILFDEVHKWTFYQQSEAKSLSYEEISNILNKVTYYDLLRNKIDKLVQNNGNKIFLTLFSSVCMHCQDQARLRIIEDIAEDRNDVECIILVGKNNNSNQTNEILLQRELHKRRIVIALVDEMSVSPQEYYNLFMLDVDPKSILVDSGGCVINVETRNTSGLFNNIEYVRNLLK